LNETSFQTRRPVRRLDIDGGISVTQDEAIASVEFGACFFRHCDIRPGPPPAKYNEPILAWQTGTQPRDPPVRTVSENEAKPRLRPGLFLDRDGVINVDREFVHRPQDFTFIDGVFDLCRSARASGYAIVVVTNQSGIAKGHFDQQVFDDLTDWMEGQFRKKDAPIDAVYHCPYHPEGTVEQFRKAHPWRKPEPGMLLSAAEELGIGLGMSLLVGDSLRDIEAARRSRIPTRLLYTGPGSNPKPADFEPAPNGAYIEIASLREAIGFLSSQKD